MSDVEDSENKGDGCMTIAGTDATEQQYSDVIAQVEREQVLINNRITWMLTFEGFLFAGLARISDSKQSPQARDALKDLFPRRGGLAGGPAGLWRSCSHSVNYDSEEVLEGTDQYGRV